MSEKDAPELDAVVEADQPGAGFLLMDAEVEIFIFILVTEAVFKGTELVLKNDDGPDIDTGPVAEALLPSVELRLCDEDIKAL